MKKELVRCKEQTTRTNWKQHYKKWTIECSRWWKVAIISTNDDVSESVNLKCRQQPSHSLYFKLVTVSCGYLHCDLYSHYTEAETFSSEAVIYNFASTGKTLSKWFIESRQQGVQKDYPATTFCKQNIHLLAKKSAVAICQKFIFCEKTVEQTVMKRLHRGYGAK